MVAACRYALLVEVLDAPHNPMAADPYRIEAPFRARRVLALPSAVGDGKGPGRSAGPNPVHLFGMKCEPAAQRVIEAVPLVSAEQEIIPRLTVQALVAGMPVGAGIGEVAGVNSWRVGVRAEQQRPIVSGQPESEGDCQPWLDDSPTHPWRSVIAHRDKRLYLRPCFDEQDPLGQLNLI